MKILVAMPYFLPHHGGLEKHVRTILMGLNQNYNYDIVVVTSNHETKEYQVQEVDNLKIYRLPIDFKVANTPIGLKWKKQMEEIVKNEKPELINGRGPNPFMPDVAYAVSKKFKIPFVLGWHFPTMRKGNLIFDPIIWLYENTFFRLMINGSKAIICSSEYVKMTLLKKVADKTTVISQGMDNSIFKYEGDIKDMHSISAIFGDYSLSTKGLIYLLKAINALKNTYPDIKLHIIGPGNKQLFIKYIIQNNLIDNVIFHGPLFGKPIVDILNKSSVFVCPSIVDNFPSTVLEAAFCKLPVITTGVGNLGYVFNDYDNGLIVKTRSSSDIVKNIKLLFENEKLRNEIGQKGYDSVINSYNWDERYQLTDKVLKSALE